MPIAGSRSGSRSLLGPRFVSADQVEQIHKALKNEHRIDAEIDAGHHPETPEYEQRLSKWPSVSMDESWSSASGRYLNQWKFNGLRCSIRFPVRTYTEICVTFFLRDSFYRKLVFVFSNSMARFEGIIGVQAFTETFQWGSEPWIHVYPGSNVELVRDPTPLHDTKHQHPELKPADPDLHPELLPDPELHPFPALLL